MEQPKTATTYATSPNVPDRARAYQHAALSELFESSFDDAFEYAHALTGDDATAERAVSAGYERVLRNLPDYGGDGHGLVPWVLGQVEEAVRRTPHTELDGVRGELSRLGHHEHQAATLRLVAGLEPTAIAAATGRRLPSVLASEMSALRSLAGLSAHNLALPAVQRQLDAALDRLLHGDPAAEAAATAPGVPEGGRLLASGESLVQLPRLGAAPATRGRVRTQFLAAGDELRAQWVHRHHVPAEVPGRRPRPKANPMGTTATLLFACVLALVAGGVLAAAAAFSSPSSAVYPLKRLGESVLLGVTTDRVAKANLEVKLSEERLKEAETEAALGHGDETVRAINDRYDELRTAAADLGAIRHRDAKWKAARDRYVTEAGKPADPLERSLQAQKQGSSANRVKAAYQRFQRDREELDKSLGVQPGTGPKPTTGAPGSIPTPGAVTGSGG